jgi:hypothetical protein
MSSNKKLTRPSLPEPGITFCSKTEFDMANSIRALPIAARITLHRDLTDGGILPSCSCCEFNVGPQEKFGNPRPQGAPDTLCTKYGSVPPIDVIVHGCVAWQVHCPF